MGGLIALGMAVDQTGTAEWIAKGIVAGMGPYMSHLLLLIILAVIYIAILVTVTWVLYL